MTDLPRFILLHGPFQTCVNFGTELMNRQGNIVNIDFEEPILDGILATFYNGDVLGFDPSDFAVRCGYMPDTKTVFQDWANQQAGLMRQSLGDDILGRIFLREFRESGYDYTHILIRDFNHPPDVQPLLKYWSQSEFCVINLGPLTDTFMANCGIRRCYWIAVPEPKAQVDQLLHELQNERAA